MKNPRHDIEKFVKRFWPQLAVGAVLVIGLSALLLRIALSGAVRRAPVAEAQFGPIVVASSTDSSLVARRLDGLPVAPDQAALEAYAVMVENSPEARPLSGPATANLVVEAPVEGGITRFMLVFDATNTADLIGPVRSARPYYVDLAQALQAVYAHVGGSPEALQKLSANPASHNLDQFFNGKYFWRSAKRDAPHNVYTRMDLLRDARATKPWTDGTFRPWMYLDGSSTSTPTGDVVSVRVPYGGTFNVTWNYTSSTRTYNRSQAGDIQKDSDGTVVTAKNVVVILSEEQVLDTYGRLRIRTTGSGKAWLFRDGQRFDLTWHRSDKGWFTFETVGGTDATLEPGRTWISIVTSPSMSPSVAASATSTQS